MASLNRVVLVGRLVRDPEKRYTASGLAVTTFTIAVDRFGKDPATGEKKTDFLRCKAWRQKAEFVEEYVKKGRLVAVDGRIETSEAVGQDGVKKYFTDIVCDNVELLESARDSAGDAAPGGNYNGGGGQSRGNSGGGSDDGDGYFADDEPAPVRQPARPAAAAAPAQRPAAPAQRPAAPARPAAKPAEAYPGDDFDDSDPFADE